MLTMSLISTISIFILITVSTKNIIFALSGIAGIASSGIFPLLIATCSTVFKENKSQTSTLLFAVSNIGVATAPYMTRTISKYNITASAFLSFIFMFITFILLFVIYFYDSRKKNNK